MQNTISRTKIFFHETSRDALKNKRRNFSVLTILPILVMLVGSCRTSQLPDSYAETVSSAAPVKFREALFPKSSLINRNEDDLTSPHSAYVSRARSIIEKEPEALMKLTQKEVKYIFGNPTFSRKDADANVWQYKTSSCVIDFYFYDGKKQNSSSNISFVDMRFKEELYPGSASKGPVSAQEQTRCLTDVVAMSKKSSSRV